MNFIKKLTMATALTAFTLGGAMAADLKPLTFSLNIAASGGHVGFVYAKKLGLYEAEGLDVTIVEGKGSATTAQVVATGQVDLAMADGPTVMQLRAKGAPLKVIAPVLQTNAYGIISLEETKVSTSKDIQGKHVGIDPGSAQAALFKGIIANEGLDASKISIVNISTPALVLSLLEKKVDIILAGADFQGVQVRDNAPSTEIMFSDVGIGSIGLSVFGREDKLSENAAEVTAFLKAGFAGWDAARKDPAAAAQALHEAFPAIPADQVLKQLEIDLKLLCNADSKTMGAVSEAAWNANHEILTTYLGVDGEKPATDYYSVDYLPSELPSCTN